LRLPPTSSTVLAIQQNSTLFLMLFKNIPAKKAKRQALSLLSWPVAQPQKR